VSNKSFEVGSIDIIRVEDSGVVEHGASTDTMSLVQQIGAIPESTRASGEESLLNQSRKGPSKPPGCGSRGLMPSGIAGCSPPRPEIRLSNPFCLGSGSERAHRSEMPVIVRQNMGGSGCSEGLRHPLLPRSGQVLPPVRVDPVEHRVEAHDADIDRAKPVGALSLGRRRAKSPHLVSRLPPQGFYSRLADTRGSS
jgi:hypothetical protein